MSHTILIYVIKNWNTSNFRKNHLGLSFFLLSCLCLSAFIWFFFIFFKPCNFDEKTKIFCMKVLYFINIDFMLPMIWGQWHSGQYNWSFLLILAFIQSQQTTDNWPSIQNSDVFDLHTNDSLRLTLWSILIIISFVF